MAGMTGIECGQRLKTLLPAIHIVMLTVYEDTDQIFNARAAGASTPNAAGGASGTARGASPSGAGGGIM